ncbi:MAG: hypothetical protein HZC55_28170 [Verrucomicrobia bacterium]|nr:hypothetical protein [Verrucomicrobiota bacterium]
MGSPTATPGSPAHDRWWLAAAGVITVGWLLVFNPLRPDYLVDEPGHLGNIYHFLEGKAGWPEAMPMLPGYHFLVAGLWQLHPPLKLLTLARLVSTVCALLGLASFALAWRRYHGTPAGPPTLLLALLPVLQPFTGLAYTDAPAVAFVLAAWMAHLAGRYAVAAVIFAAATCLRQTSLIWAGFVVLWDLSRGVSLREIFTPRHLAAAWPRLRWLALLGVAAAVTVLTAGRLTVGTGHGNPATFNPAQIHFAGWLLLLLGLPLWLRAATNLPRWYADRLRTRTGWTVGGTALFLGAAVGLATTYANPHPWNRDLFWEGCSFTLLRNWPLVWVDRFPVLRCGSGLLLAALAACLVAIVRRHPHGRALALTGAAGFVPALISSLVEPRYFIPGLVFGLFFAPLPPAATRTLLLWWGALVLVHAPFVARGLSLW